MRIDLRSSTCRYGVSEVSLWAGPFPKKTKEKKRKEKELDTKETNAGPAYLCV